MSYEYLRRIVPDQVVDERLIPELVTRVATANDNIPSCWGDPMDTIREIRGHGVVAPVIGVAVRAHLHTVYSKNGPKAWEIEQRLTRLLLPENVRQIATPQRRPRRPAA